MDKLHYVDLGIIITYLLGCLIISFYKAKTIHNIKEYTLGSGYISTIVLFSTLFATHIGAGSTIGVAGKIHEMGIIFLISELLNPLFWLIGAIIFGRAIGYFKGCLSLSDIMENLYGLSGKWITNVLSVIVSVGVMAVQMTALGNTLQYFIGIPYNIGVVIGTLIIVIYSAFGGIRIVVLTDLFQFLVFFIAFPLACIFALYDIGGIENFLSQIPESHLQITSETKSVLFLSGIIFYAFIPESAGSFVQRFLMANDSKQLIKTMQLVTIASFCLAIFICLIGFIVKVKAPDIDSSISLMYFINYYLPTGVKGLLIAGILAVLMSTADSFLNTSSVLCAHDICKKIFPNITEFQEVAIARGSTFIIGILSIFLSLGDQNVLELVWVVDSFWQPIILVPLVAGFLQLKATSRAFICSSILAFFATILGAYIEGELAIVSMFFGIIGSALGFFSMYFFEKNPKIRSIADTLSIYHIKYIYKRIIIALKHLKNFFAISNISSSLNMRVRKYGEFYYESGLVAIVYYVFTLYMNFVVQSKIFIYPFVYLMYSIAMCCAALLLFQEYFVFRRRQCLLPIYWYLSICYCLPFLSLFTLLLCPNEQLLILNIVISTVFLAFLMDLGSFISLTLLGYLLALGLHYTLDIKSYRLEDTVTNINYYYQPLFYGLFSVIVLGAIKKMQDDKLEDARLLGGAIAHELATPLAKISMKISRIKTSDDETQEIKSGVLNAVQKSQDTINIILTNLKYQASLQEEESFRVSACIEEALQQVILGRESENYIKLHMLDDFQIKANKQHVVRIICNLLANALSFIDYHKVPEIVIEAYRYHGTNILTISDNGLGIPRNNLANIFKPFYSSGKIGYGIGLAFCDATMKKLGGAIECVSEEKKYTKFILKFPQVANIK